MWRPLTPVLRLRGCGWGHSVGFMPYQNPEASAVVMHTAGSACAHSWLQFRTVITGRAQSALIRHSWLCPAWLALAGHSRLWPGAQSALARGIVGSGRAQSALAGHSWLWSGAQLALAIQSALPGHSRPWSHATSSGCVQLVAVNSIWDRPCHNAAAPDPCCSRSSCRAQLPRAACGSHPLQEGPVQAVSVQVAVPPLAL